MKNAPVTRFVRLSLFAGLALVACETAGAATYQFNVSGEVDYQFKTSGTYTALNRVTVKVYNADFGEDELLATTCTNSSGEYDVQVTSDESDGPDIYVRVILEDYDSSVVEVEDDGDEEYLESDTHDDQTTDVTVDVSFSSSTGKNDEAHLYQVIYDALHSTNFGTKNMDQVHATRSGVEDDEAFFETTDLAEVHIGTDHVWYLNDNSAYGNWAVLHEVGHAIMWAMRGHAWPPLGAAPDPHAMNQEAGRGFAWIEGWAHIYASEKDGVAESTSNWNFNDPDSLQRCGSPYWAGGVNSDGSAENPATGTDNSGLCVEGAIASAGYLIGFDTIWPIVRDNGATVNSFEDVWDHLSKTQTQRKHVEKNNMIFSRGRLAQIWINSLPWRNFVDGHTVSSDDTVALRAEENTEAALNLSSGEGESVTGMRFSYRAVSSLSHHREWFPHDSGWTVIGTATSKTNGYWMVSDWDPPEPGDYWIRVQTLHGSGESTTRDTIQPSEQVLSFFTAMRAWSRNTLLAVRYLKVDDLSAGDPSFVQRDRRRFDALAQARVDRARALKESGRRREFARLLQGVRSRVSARTDRR